MLKEPESERIEYKNYFIIFNNKKYKKIKEQQKKLNNNLKTYKINYKNNTKTNKRKEIKNKINKLQHSKMKPYMKIKPLHGLNPSLRKEICAFLNNGTQNGIKKSDIYLGIDDKTLKVSKICKDTYNYDLFYKIQRELSQWLYKYFIPPATPYVHVSLPQRKAYTPIQIHINSPLNKCFWTKLKGKWNLIIRNGSSSEPPTPENSYRLIKRTILYQDENSTYDSLPCNYHHLSFSYLRKRCKQVGISFKGLQRNTGLQINPHLFSNAALLLSDKTHITRAKIHIVYPTKTIVKTIDGSLIKQIDQIINNLKLYHKLHNLPLQILKDSVLNAYSHRSYNLYRQEYIEIYISTNRILISSPGIFANGLSLKSIYKGTYDSFLRNPIIFYILNKIYTKNNNEHGLIEIFNYYKNKDFNKLPIIWCDKKVDRTNIVLPCNKENRHTNNVYNSKYLINNAINNSIFMAKLNALRATTKVKTHIKKVIYYFRYKKHITHSDIEDICKITSTPASHIINILKKRNLIKRHGKSRGTYYTKNFN